jgi:SAM-dependent methyltransferase
MARTHPDEQGARMATGSECDAADLLALYDDAFYRQAILWQGPSAFNVARAIVESYQPRNLIDVGCGPGTYLVQFRLLGIDVHGLEGSDAALRRCRDQHLSVEQIDLRMPHGAGRAFDLALCFEVAEHLPPSASSTLVDTLATYSEHIVFTAALSGQGGTGHINERPLAFWDSLFAQRGFVTEPDRIELLIRQFARDPDINPWLLQNLRCYRSGVDHVWRST